MKDVNKGVLYICSSHLGNIKDLTYRTIDTLKKVDIIYAEDTRHFREIALLHDIRTPTESYHLFNEHDKLYGALHRLKNGLNIALICDRGTPVVNDPGFVLIREYSVIGTVRIIPGASAAISAFVLSGFSHRYMFLGFLKKYNELANFVNFPYSIVIFEAPHRIYKFFESALSILGNRNICICRELTKIYEEVIYCDLLSIPEFVCKGEFTIVIEGYKKK